MDQSKMTGQEQIGEFPSFSKLAINSIAKQPSSYPQQTKQILVDLILNEKQIIRQLLQIRIVKRELVIILMNPTNQSSQKRYLLSGQSTHPNSTMQNQILQFQQSAYIILQQYKSVEINQNQELPQQFDGAIFKSFLQLSCFQLADQVFSPNSSNSSFDGECDDLDLDDCSEKKLNLMFRDDEGAQLLQQIKTLKQVIEDALIRKETQKLVKQMESGLRQITPVNSSKPKQVQRKSSKLQICMINNEQQQFLGFTRFQNGFIRCVFYILDDMICYRLNNQNCSQREQIFEVLDKYDDNLTSQLLKKQMKQAAKDCKSGVKLEPTCDFQSIDVQFYQQKLSIKTEQKVLQLWCSASDYQVAKRQLDRIFV